MGRSRYNQPSADCREEHQAGQLEIESSAAAEANWDAEARREAEAEVRRLRELLKERGDTE